MHLMTRVYGVLFVAGDEGVNRQELAQSLDVSLTQINDALSELSDHLEDDMSPIKLVSYNQKYQLVTKEELEEDVKAFAQAPFSQILTRAAIETLAIIAYRQPVTRMAIEEIRGVQSTSILQKLMARNLVKEVGRIEAPGRPVLYGVTNYFMDYFGLQSLEDLPTIEPLAINTQLVSDELFNIKEWQIEIYDENPIEEGETE